MNLAVHPCAAVILAAGASSRMGSPKALLEIGGETFLDRLIGLFAGVCDPVVVVLGHDAGQIRAGIARSAQPLFVLNPSPEAGMLSSLQAGLCAVPHGCRSIFFHPCDMPEIKSPTLDLLLDALAASPESTLAALPALNGRPGHPVLLRSSFIPAFLALQPGDTARRLLEREPQLIVRVPVDDPAVGRDFDTREQYTSAFGARP